MPGDVIKSIELDKPEITPPRSNLEGITNEFAEYQIRDEARRRFQATQTWLDVTNQLFDLQYPPDRNEALVDPGAYPEDELWDSMPEGSIDYRMTQAELEDETVQEYLETLVGLKLIVKSQQDEYTEGKQPDEADQVLAAIEYQYRQAKQKILKELRERERKGAPKGPNARSYYRFIDDINPRQYEILSERIVEECEKNSYLTQLFQFLPTQQYREMVNVMWPEKAQKYAEAHFRKLETPRDHQLRDEWQEHLLAQYGQYGLKTVPQVILVPYSQRGAWQRLLNINPNPNPLEAILSPGTQGGAYIPYLEYGPHRVPMNLTYSVTSPRAPEWFVAEVMFEEMNHSILTSFPPKSTVRGEYWPLGYGGQGGNVLEEGFVGVEKFVYYLKHHPDYFDNPRMFSLQIKNYLEGIPEKMTTNSTAATIMLIELLRRCGGENGMELMRAARTNQTEALEELRTKVNALLGETWNNDRAQDEFTRLFEMKTNRDDLIWSWVRRLRDIPSPTGWPLA